MENGNEWEHVCIACVYTKLRMRFIFKSHRYIGIDKRNARTRYEWKT